MRYLYTTCTLPTFKRIFERVSREIRKNDAIGLGLKNCTRYDERSRCYSRVFFQKTPKNTFLVTSKNF
jgi:hypothetical protein